MKTRLRRNIGFKGRKYFHKKGNYTIDVKLCLKYTQTSSNSVHYGKVFDIPVRQFKNRSLKCCIETEGQYFTEK